MISRKFNYMIVLAFALVLSALQGCDRMRTADDNTIIDKVKSKLMADSTLTNTSIDVDSTDGVVNLSGTVENATQEQTAKKLAASVDGVKKVETNLVIKAPETAIPTNDQGTTGTGGYQGTQKSQDMQKPSPTRDSGTTYPSTGTDTQPQD